MRLGVSTSEASASSCEQRASRTLFLDMVDMGCVASESAKLICERSILDCDPLKFEYLSDNKKGVSLTELEVQALEHECVL